ncbi:MAG TPA: AgmX/PglI C-terminal domain-containing protein [Anaeromyxobacter sp.]|nr:AgmX/PglI C-terminal domain-containing protein [Anaeromyxobacter sp.]
MAGRAFRAKCPDCQGVLEVAAARADALDDKDLAWLASEGKPAEPQPSEPLFEKPEVVEKKVAEFAARTAAQRRWRGLAMVAGAIVAVGAVAFAGVWAVGRLGGPGPFSRRAREERAARAAATYDASVLLAKAAPAPEPAPALAPRAAPAIRKKGKTITRDDRRLLDLLAKKDDVTVIPEADEALDSAQGSLDPDAVGRTVAKNRKAFDACISKALRLNPSLNVARRATLVVTVQPNGAVTGAFIAEEEVDRTDLGACLSAAARRMVFPAFEGEPIDVSMPLSLSAVF